MPKKRSARLPMPIPRAATPSSTSCAFSFAVKGPDAARQELVARIAAGGDVFPYQMALADLDYTQGQASESVALLDKLSKSADSDEHKRAAKIKLAEQQIGQKNYDAAELVVADILAKDQRNVSGLKLRASIRIAEGQVEPAIADLREAINEQPESADLLRLLAIAYERSGSIELADEAFGKATKASKFAPGCRPGICGFSATTRKGRSRRRSSGRAGEPLAKRRSGSFGSSASQACSAGLDRRAASCRVVAARQRKQGCC